MKKIVFVFAAFALSAASQQALACDYGVHAHNSASTVVVCDNNGCAAVQPAQEAAVPKVTDDSAPTTVAQK